jgi:hypothetical protein
MIKYLRKNNFREKRFLLVHSFGGSVHGHMVLSFLGLVRQSIMVEGCGRAKLLPSCQPEAEREDTEKTKDKTMPHLTHFLQLGPIFTVSIPHPQVVHSIFVNFFFL